MSEPAESPQKSLDGQLDDQLALEWTRKASLEQRGINIITASGALVTLVFAVSAIVTKAETFKFFRGWEHWLLVASLVFFVSAAICGILVNRVSRYRALDFPTLDAWMRARRKPLPRGRSSDSYEAEEWIDHAIELLGRGNPERARQFISARPTRFSESIDSQRTLDQLNQLIDSLRSTDRNEEVYDLVNILSGELRTSRTSELTAYLPSSVVQRSIAELELRSLPMRKYNILQSARYYNYHKARLVAIAMIFEVIAITLVAISIVFLLASA